MESDKQLLVYELCSLAVKRNEINTRRHRARYRKNYYEKAIRVVEAHQGSNAKLRHLEKHNHNGARQAAIDAVLSDMKYIVKENPNPKKWLDMGLHKLRSLVLKAKGEYAIAKHETMEFTILHRERVKYLVAELNCMLSYDNGSIKAIAFKGKGTGAVLYCQDIKERAEQYELNQAIEMMVEE